MTHGKWFHIIHQLKIRIDRIVGKYKNTILENPTSIVPSNSRKIELGELKTIEDLVKDTHTKLSQWNKCLEDTTDESIITTKQFFDKLNINYFLMNSLCSNIGIFINIRVKPFGK